MLSSTSDREARRPRLKSLIHHEAVDNRQRRRIEGNARAFAAVLRVYAELRATSPIGAATFDPTGHRNGLIPVHIEFLSDVDKAVASCLRRDDAAKFIKLVAFEYLSTDEEKNIAKSAAGISLKTESRIAQVLGATFVARELRPPQYFCRVRRTNRFEQVPHHVRMSPDAPVQAAGTDDTAAADLDTGYKFGIVDDTLAA